MTAKSARLTFFAALGLYLLWFGALVALAIVSGERPVENRSRSRSMPPPATAPVKPELPKN